jgi:hypothetical protein
LPAAEQTEHPQRQQRRTEWQAHPGRRTVAHALTYTRGGTS